jgi:hypothetical protein
MSCGIAQGEPHEAAACSCTGAHGGLHGNPAETRECKWLGDVTGSQGNSYTGQYTTNANLETGARNDLKNKAAALGGNLVVLITERPGLTGNFGLEGGPVHQTSVTLTGSVYRCPS